ncbi:uronyl 2-sulfotransferase-like [Saccoglossus kowalevskii]|uniref:Uronyl 2-sulfotransferase-like n=1 Tax=Saccoglossus kowalevskii TaxID=10224 RepID=A0ABM0GZ75_SACKO|nr:PREDICTED: uronyl 2-sulfotransferase-like [Saccoglossus kowalevskii]
MCPTPERNLKPKMGILRMCLSPRKVVTWMTLTAATGLLFLAAKESEYMSHDLNYDESFQTEARNFSERQLGPKTPLRVEVGLPTNLNFTFNITRLIYNRVGKCGSRSLQYVNDILSRWNRFNHIKSMDFHQKRFSDEQQMQVVKEISELEAPFIYDRHVNFLDFTKFGHSRVPYINLVRDPLERVMSFFYYKRYGDMIDKKELDPSLNNTFEDCVLKEMSECSSIGPNRMVPFFCGHSEECMKPTRWALETALRNIIENYVFVGTIEDFPTTLYILEFIMPQFFTGASDSYKLVQSRGHVDAFKTAYKEEASEEMKEIMRERLAPDYVLYTFIKKRVAMTKKYLELMYPDRQF